MLRKVDPRFNKISELFINFSLGNFDYRVDISPKQDEIDAFISSINMLGEELKTTTISRNYFNNIFHSVSDMLFVLNLNGTIKDINKTVIEKLQYSVQDIKGKKIDQILNTQNESVYSQIESSFNEKKQLVNFETTFCSSLNTKILAQCQCNYLYTEQGEKIGYLLIARDLTKIKQYEEKYHKIFKESSDVMFIIETNGLIKDMNQAGIDRFHIDKKKLYSFNYFDLFKRDGDKKFFQGKVKLGKPILDFETTLTNGPYKIRNCLISANTILNENNQVSGYQGIIKDITKKRKTENLVIKAIVNTQEKERERFARDLHDSLGQQLSAIKFYIGTLKDMDTPSIKESEKSTLLLSKSNDVLNNVITELRNICFNMMPRAIEEFGLLYALQELCRKIEADSLLKFQLETDPELSINEKALEIAIYRIVQEFINNAIRHGNASKINIQMHVRNKKLFITMKDNGKGFRIKKDFIHQGIGLQNIRTRVQSYNGDLKIKSAINKGTEFNIKIPL